MNDVLKKRWPNLAEHMADDMKKVCERYGLETSPFGHFWNFCVNSPMPSERVHNVLCKPHIDAKNGTLLVCAIFVYYYGGERLYLSSPHKLTLCLAPSNADEKIWLVLWEAGIIIQIPAGCVVMFPSALFMHFNINMDGAILITACSLSLQL